MTLPTPLQSPHVAALPEEAQSPAAQAPVEMGLLEQLLRSPDSFFARLDGSDTVPLARALFLQILFGCGSFGVVVGSYRGGLQSFFCALKFPLLALGTLILCAPTYLSLVHIQGVAFRAREAVLLALGATARLSLVLGGLAPVLWLTMGSWSYHALALAIVGAFGLAGLAAASMLFRGLAQKGVGSFAGFVLVVLYAIVGAHSAWILRPYLVRPKTESVPFVRGLEGDLLQSVLQSRRSVQGVYGPRVKGW